MDNSAQSEHSGLYNYSRKREVYTTYMYMYHPSPICPLLVGNYISPIQIKYIPKVHPKSSDLCS